MQASIIKKEKYPTISIACIHYLYKPKENLKTIEITVIKYH